MAQKNHKTRKTYQVKLVPDEVHGLPAESEHRIVNGQARTTSQTVIQHSPRFTANRPLQSLTEIFERSATRLRLPLQHSSALRRGYALMGQDGPRTPNLGHTAQEIDYLSRHYLKEGES